jgi:hypothetical protein
MKTTVRFLSAFQVLAGVFSLTSLWQTTDALGWQSVLFLLGFSVLSIVAGVLLWQGSWLGWRMTIANQLTQLIGFNSPMASFSVVHCAAVTVSCNFAPGTTFANSLISESAAASLLHSICDVMIGRRIELAPNYCVTLNLVAAGILFYGLFYRNGSRQLADQTLP